MNWKDKCYQALNARKMFESSGHKSRFKELLDCYWQYPFFTPGLCKCMYLSAWDEEHFFVMLETLTDLSLGRERDTKDMKEKGDLLAEEKNDGEAYIYQLSVALLEGAPFSLGEDVLLDEATAYIIQRALEASDIIDQVEP